MKDLCHRKLSCFDIEINILYNIVVAGGVHGLKAGIHIIPHTIPGKEIVNLFAGQILGIFVLSTQ